MTKQQQSETTKPVRKLYGNYKKIQNIYEEKGLKSVEFYKQVLPYIKSLLHKYLIQNQFDEDNINDCFAVIYEKVEGYYDEDKGILGNFIHTVIRNYCTKINYRIKKYKPPIQLDFEYINKEELREYTSTETMGVEGYEVSYDLDNVENFCSGLTAHDVFQNIEKDFDMENQVHSIKEIDDIDFSEACKKDAIRKDLLWRVFQQAYTEN